MPEQTPHPRIAEPDKFVEMKWGDFDSVPQPLFLPWKQLLVSSFISDIKRAVEGTMVQKHG